ncbi:MAG: chaperone modulator CbpM [Ferruginibacter sp.]
MATAKYIAAKEFCRYHNISLEFISLLKEHELIELVVEKKTAYIPQKQLQQLEIIIRLHNELQVNAAGIPLVLQLINQLQQKEQEVQQLKNLLNFYSSSI